MRWSLKPVRERYCQVGVYRVCTSRSDSFVVSRKRRHVCGRGSSAPDDVCERRVSRVFFLRHANAQSYWPLGADRFPARLRCRSATTISDRDRVNSALRHATHLLSQWTTGTVYCCRLLSGVKNPSSGKPRRVGHRIIKATTDRL